MYGNSDGLASGIIVDAGGINAEWSNYIGAVEGWDGSGSIGILEELRKMDFAIKELCYNGFHR